MEHFNLIPDNFENLSREELLQIIRNIKNQTTLSTNSKSTLKQETSSAFDFSRYKKRHVALKFLYLGWDYSGFSVQNHSPKTIEEQLFNALLKTKLIASRESSNYHRCGRTDKGVSAFSQVISLDLRSNLLEGKGIITPKEYNNRNAKASDKEINYVAVLNKVLPPEIRIIGWAPVDTEFSARFDCIQRTYKYWFPVGNLNIEKMLLAAQKLVGEHDFRNFCKMDVGNGVVNYKRKIFEIDLQKLNESKRKGYDIAELTVVGQAFLYHQIRCIVSILCLIGLEKEDPSIIDLLLNVSEFPKKPQYNIASEIPLVLFNCSYSNFEWTYDKECLTQVIKHLQCLWAEYSIKTIILKKMLTELEAMTEESVVAQADIILPGIKSRVYKKLIDRPFCDSLEERIEHYSKKPKKKLKFSYPSTDLDN